MYTRGYAPGTLTQTSDDSARAECDPGRAEVPLAASSRFSATSPPKNVAPPSEDSRHAPYPNDLTIDVCPNEIPPRYICAGTRSMKTLNVTRFGMRKTIGGPGKAYDVLTLG